VKIENLSLAEIVIAKPETAALVENYNLDLCCGGKQKLSEVLKNDADKLKEVTSQLENIFEKGTPPETDFNKFSLT
jgi:iron-sulfur cluster repair protein YtfE (RIC family)